MTVHAMPDQHLDFAAAREVLHAPAATREQLLDACFVLSASPDWVDVVLVREVRNRLWKVPRLLTYEELHAAGVHARMAEFWEAYHAEADAARAGRKATRAVLLAVAIAAAAVFAGMLAAKAHVNTQIMLEQMK